MGWVRKKREKKKGEGEEEEKRKRRGIKGGEEKGANKDDEYNK
jgi:hypothetical protein